MSKKCGSIAKEYSLKNMVKRLFEVSSMCVVAHAEGEVGNSEPDKSGNEEPNKGPTFNYEDLIAKARKEEKEKQYGAINKLKGQVETMTEQHNNDLLKIANLEKQVKDLETKIQKGSKGDDSVVKELKDTIATLQKDKKDLETKLQEFQDTPPVDTNAIYEQVRSELEQEYEVKAYKIEQMAEHKDDILVPELVMGNTKEEIDNSIKSAIERSNSIKSQLGIDGNSNKRTPKTNTPNGVQTTQYTVEYLASLDPRSPEYAEVRKNLGLR